MADNLGLGYKPPKGLPTTSEFGGKIPDGLYDSEAVGWKLNQKNPDNAFIEIRNLEFPEEGKFSMNLYLPTQHALNQKAMELKGSIPDEQLKERVKKSFFHYGQTMRSAGIPNYEDFTIEEALNKLVGWKGKAVYETRAGFNTSVKKILGAKEAKAITSTGDAPQVF